MLHKLTIRLGMLVLVAELAACAPSPIVMKAEDGSGAGFGEVEQSFREPHRVVVTLGNDTYVGEWKRRDAPDHPDAHSYLHWRQVGRVATTLTSADGRHIDCNWLVENLSGYGTCEDDRRHVYNVVIGNGHGAPKRNTGNET